jgi:RHS repeat-associated protein
VTSQCVLNNNGNTLTKVTGSNTTSYAWDFENRMSSVTLPGSGGTVSFKYDPFGRRIYKFFSAGTTSVYAYDGDNLVEETNATGAVVARYSQTQNIDEPLAMLRSAATSYFHADGLGSVTSLSNAAGSIANTYTYDSFGKLTASTGSLVNPFRYTARESDTETGLYYYRARYYDASTGRFLSEDAFGANSDDLNFYRYVHNSPIGYTDPHGYGRTYGCGARCKFRLDKNDPFKGDHINWECNGLKGCLLWPSLRPCEVSKSNIPPKRLLRCIDDNLPKPKACPITDFEIQKGIESTQDLEKFWLDILIGDVALGAVGTAGALGWLGGGAAAGGAAGAPRPLPFPNPAPRPIPIPVKPAA